MTSLSTRPAARFWRLRPLSVSLQHLALLIVCPSFHQSSTMHHSSGAFSFIALWDTCMYLTNDRKHANSQQVVLQAVKQNMNIAPHHWGKQNYLPVYVVFPVGISCNRLGQHSCLRCKVSSGPNKNTIPTGTVTVYWCANKLLLLKVTQRLAPCCRHATVMTTRVAKCSSKRRARRLHVRSVDMKLKRPRTSACQVSVSH